MKITESKLRLIVESYQKTIDREKIHQPSDLEKYINTVIPVEQNIHEVITVSFGGHKGLSAYILNYHLYGDGTPLSIEIYPSHNCTTIKLCADQLISGYEPCTDRKTDTFGNLRQQKTIPQAKIPQASELILKDT